MLRSLMASFLVLALPFVAFAGSPQFNNLSAKDFDDITKELSGNFMHHSVQGAASLGSIFGFEVGLVGGQEASPNIDSIVKSSGGSGLPNLYHAGLLGVLTVPFGLTGEAMLLPKQSSNGADFQMTSLALKWTLTDELVKVPFVNIALRYFYTTSQFNFDQTSSGVAATITDKDQVNGIQLLVSPALWVVEPYVGVGLVNSTNSLSTTGTSIFNPTYTSSQSSNTTVSSTQLLAGISAHLLFFHIGAEYSNAFGASSYTGKLAFGF